jgi:hypothetical protein
MSARLQSFILKNNFGLANFINNKLAPRGGLFGAIGKALYMGERQYGAHVFGRTLRVANYFWMITYQILAMQKGVASRFIGVQSAGLNYAGIYTYVFIFLCIQGRFRMIRHRDVLEFNRQDNPEFWFGRYNMMFPPSFLHNRISAHYIEINHIFAVEMMKKYQKVRKDVILERETHGDFVKRT